MPTFPAGRRDRLIAGTLEEVFYWCPRTVIVEPKPASTQAEVLAAC